MEPLCFEDSVLRLPQPRATPISGILKLLTALVFLLPMGPCGAAIPGLASGSAVKCKVAENEDIVFIYALLPDGTPELSK